MVKRTYTKEQRKTLLKNKNVAKLGKGVISYTKAFKIKAVKQYQEEYMTPQEIFREAGFNIGMIGKNKPKNCLERWNKVYKEEGFRGLMEIKEKRGRLKKVKDKSAEDKLERLEAENAYLKAEVVFLVKLRAKKGLN